MVVGAFPAFKLGALAIKQMSKPVANVIKERAKASPVFSKYVCMPPAQAYNWVEVKTKMWAMNLGRPTKVPQLNEAMAIELGANLLGEFILFAIGAGILIFEYVRQAKKETKKEQALASEKEDLLNRITELSLEVERHAAVLREINRHSFEKHQLKVTPINKSKENTTTDANSNEIVESNNITNNGKYNSNDGYLFKALNELQILKLNNVNDFSNNETSKSI